MPLYYNMRTQVKGKKEKENSTGSIRKQTRKAILAF